MSTFGWCNSGHHTLCRVEFKPWYIGPKRVGRKMVDSIIPKGTIETCSCICHIPEDERPKKKRAVRRKK